MLAVPLQPAAATPSTNCSNDKVSNGYAATSNYHGINVPMGAPVTVYGCTTDTSVTRALFTWHDPHGNVVFSDLVTTYTTVTDGSGAPARQFTDMQTPNKAGDWGVQIAFCPATGNCVNNKGSHSATIDIKATSFMVLPEVPIVGTALLGGVMIGGFVLYSRKQRRTNTINRS